MFTVKSTRVTDGHTLRLSCGEMCERHVPELCCVVLDLTVGSMNADPSHRFPIMVIITIGINKSSTQKFNENAHFCKSGKSSPAQRAGTCTGCWLVLESGADGQPTAAAASRLAWAALLSMNPLIPLYIL